MFIQKVKRAGALALALCMAVLVLAACGGEGGSSSVPGSSSTPQSSSVQQESSSLPDSSLPAPEKQTVKLAGLKGPTTMGMVKLMEDAEQGLATHDYQVEMAGTADVIVPRLVSGELDAAALPANLAATLYNSTEGKLRVVAINTLGVLYLVETDETIQSVEDLRGKTIYSTGKGTTPEFALYYILRQNGLEPGVDVTVEFKAEATEIAALLSEGADAIAVLPQPYVTAVQLQNENVRVALDLTAEWDKVGEGSALVTGVLVVREEFWAAAVESGLAADLLADYQASIEWVNANTADAAALVEKFGIVEKAAVAQKALPYCNIVYIDGDEMQARLEGYLQALFDQNPEAVGGAMPAGDFYRKL